MHVVSPEALPIKTGTHYDLAAEIGEVAVLPRMNCLLWSSTATHVFIIVLLFIVKQY